MYGTLLNGGRMRNYTRLCICNTFQITQKSALSSISTVTGKLLLAPEDMEFDWDILIGAVHFIEGFKRGAIDQRTAEKLFMREF